MHARKPCLTALLILLLAAPPTRARTVGLASDAVNPVYAEQKQSQWCWAACIQMIANLYGADLTQDEVVARSYGPGVNRAGTFEVITDSLNASGTTPGGRTYRMTSTMLGNRLLPAALVEQLTAGHPVLLGYDAGRSGHAVVCTAVSYDGPASDPIITALTVRDPWPSSDNRNGSGRRVVRGSDLGPRILEGWVIQVVVHDRSDELVAAPQGHTSDDPGTVPATMTASNSARQTPPAPAPDNRRFTRADDTDDDEEDERPRRVVSDAEKTANELMTLFAERQVRTDIR